MTLTNQQYRDIYKKLSPQKREAIASPEIGVIIDDIAKSYGLDKKNRDSIAFIIKDLIYEVDTLPTATKKISGVLVVGEDIAIKIAKDINDKILNNLEKIHQLIQSNIRAENIVNGIEEYEEEEEETNQQTPGENRSGEQKEIVRKIRLSIKDKTRNDLPEYLKNLPQSVQDLVLDNTWENRVNEIAKKYSFNEMQTDTLIDNVLFVLIELEKPEDFIEIIIAKLGISRLLAEQVKEDLEIRVFEYAAKTVENKQKRNQATVEPERKNEAPSVPEIRPENLPMIKERETIHINPTPSEKTEEIEEKISIPRYVPKISPEPVQRPVPVPRLIATEISDKEPDRAPVQQNTNDVKITEKTPVVDIKKEDAKPISKYAADPYREPIE